MSSVADFLNQLKAYGQDLSGAPPIDIFSGGFSKASAPFLIAKASKEASGLLDQGITASLGQFAEGYGQSERIRREQQGYGYAEAGVNPVQAQRMMAEQDAGRGSQVAQFRAGLEQQRAQGEMDILGTATSGLIQSEQYQDSLDLQKYISDQQTSAAKRAGKYGMIGNIAGAALNLFAPGSGLLTGALGGMFGGGGTPGLTSKLNVPSELGNFQPTMNFGSPFGTGYGPSALSFPLSYNALQSNLFKAF